MIRTANRCTRTMNSKQFLVKLVCATVLQFFGFMFVFPISIPAADLAYIPSPALAALLAGPVFCGVTWLSLKLEAQCKRPILRYHLLLYSLILVFFLGRGLIFSSRGQVRAAAPKAQR